MDDLVSAQASARERSGGFVLPCGCGGLGDDGAAFAAASAAVVAAPAGELSSLRQQRLERRRSGGLLHGGVTCTATVACTLDPEEGDGN
jgi:hypothetical protein